jgi:hypothetical protein
VNPRARDLAAQATGASAGPLPLSLPACSAPFFLSTQDSWRAVQREHAGIGCVTLNKAR